LFFFVGDVTMGAGLRIFSPLRRALSLNPTSQFFLKFYWNLGYNASL